MHPTKPAQLLDLRAAERLNLAVLKRIDLAIEEVCTMSIFGPILTRLGDCLQGLCPLCALSRSWHQRIMWPCTILTKRATSG